ncbi:hypothetical protein [Polaribacter sp. M15]
MTFKEKLKLPEFWLNFLKVFVPFFIILILITLLWKNWNAFFKGDFNLIADENFRNGKWMVFFGVKMVTSIIYGLYVTNKNIE